MVLVIDAATYFVSFLLLLAFIPVVQAAPAEGDLAGVLAGVRYLCRDRLLRTLSVAQAGSESPAGDGSSDARAGRASFEDEHGLRHTRDAWRRCRSRWRWGRASRSRARNCLCSHRRNVDHERRWIRSSCRARAPRRQVGCT
jgi:hypothetical protein